MSIPLLRSAGALGALALTLATAPSAFAASSVYGGSTGDGEPIVLTGDGAAKKLRSAVIATESKCDNDMSFPYSAKVTPVKLEAGFDPGLRDLVVTRNAKGRFAGTVTTGYDLGDVGALVETTLIGKLKGKRASGSISTDVGIVDKQTGAQTASCQTGRVSWSATRSPGRVYGGASSQEEPVVVRLDAKRKKVSDILASWETASCTPDDFLRFPDRFTNFPLHAGHFGDSFHQTFDGPDGAKRTYAYTVDGKVGRRSAKGTLQVGVTGTDAAGATTLSCETGNVTWKAATG